MEEQRTKLEKERSLNPDHSEPASVLSETDLTKLEISKKEEHCAEIQETLESMTKFSLNPDPSESTIKSSELSETSKSSQLRDALDSPPAPDLRDQMIALMKDNIELKDLKIEEMEQELKKEREARKQLEKLIRQEATKIEFIAKDKEEISKRLTDLKGKNDKLAKEMSQSKTTFGNEKRRLEETVKQLQNSENKIRNHCADVEARLKNVTKKHKETAEIEKLKDLLKAETDNNQELKTTIARMQNRKKIDDLEAKRRIVALKSNLGGQQRAHHKKVENLNDELFKCRALLERNELRASHSNAMSTIIGPQDTIKSISYESSTDSNEPHHEIELARSFDQGPSDLQLHDDPSDMDFNEQMMEEMVSRLISDPSL